jgi:uncharacterized protein YndB with AHSA1/START domain
MDARTEGGLMPPAFQTEVQRVSDLELRVTRSFDAPARLVYKAWTTPALFMRWWAPRSIGMSILSCDMDVRTGGGYRLAFGADEASAMVFHGRYIEVVPDVRLVWTNDEGEEGAVTTVSFADVDGQTQLTYSDVYPSKEAMDESLGAEAALPEQFTQLDEVLATLED